MLLQDGDLTDDQFVMAGVANDDDRSDNGSVDLANHESLPTKVKKWVGLGKPKQITPTIAPAAPVAAVPAATTSANSQFAFQAHYSAPVGEHLKDTGESEETAETTVTTTEVSQLNLDAE